MVTITIIGMLAGLMLGALQASRQAAREYATKATIAKLNNIIMERYESYLNRRVPINTSGFPPRIAAAYRLFTLRDMMRMEMPERWEDTTGATAYPNTTAADKPENIPLDCTAPIIQQIVLSWCPTGSFITPYADRITVTLPNGMILPIARKSPSPALARLFWQRRWQAHSYLIASPPAGRGLSNSDANDKVAANGGAECLYMIVALGNPEALEQFSQSEIGDVDEDTLPEFLDGWGHPISFLRWAPGFNNSDVQPNIDPSWNTPTAVLQQRQDASNNDHDPFDPRKTDVKDSDPLAPASPPDPFGWPTGWRLVPLIYSAGPDGQFGLYDIQGYTYLGNPYKTIVLTGGTQVGIGAPTPANTHFDNITNHSIEQR